MSLAEQPGEKSPFSDPSSEDLPEQIRRVAENCSDCGLCRKSCRFLEKYGTPLHIARRYTPDDPAFLKMAFECSLCGLCTAVCPAGVDPSAVFLAMRREYVGRGYESVASGCVFLGYERRGTSHTSVIMPCPRGATPSFSPAAPCRERALPQHWTSIGTCVKQYRRWGWCWTAAPSLPTTWEGKPILGPCSGI